MLRRLPGSNCSTGLAPILAPEKSMLSPAANPLMTLAGAVAPSISSVPPGPLNTIGAVPAEAPSCRSSVPPAMTEPLAVPPESTVSVRPAAIAAGLTLTVDSGGTANGSVIAGGTLDLQDGASAGTAPIVFNGPGGTLEIDGATAPANVISGFAAGDSIDFSGANIGANPVLQLLPGNLLSMTEHNKTYDFQFDPNDDFTGQTFHAIGDGHSGTLIFIDPGVLSVATSGPDITAGSGDLNAGHQVTLTLNTNEPIDVDTSQGTPTLTLNDGGTATYTGGSGSDALNFQYTVASGENTPDLAVTAFNANGAAAGDANGHAAVFTDTVGNPAGTLQIDTTPPQLTGISI